MLDVADEATDSGVDARMPRRDAGSDAGAPDAGPIVTCRADRECADTPCVGDRARMGADLAPMPLACEPLRAGTADGETCDRNTDCARSLCAVAGTCVRPCVADTDCAPDRRCQQIYVRSADASLQPLDACADRWNLPPSASATETELAGALTGSPSGDEILLPAVSPTSVVMLGALTGSASLVRLETRDPVPVVLFDVDALGFGVPPPLNPMYPDGSPVIVMLPNGPRGVTSDAGYRAVVVSERASALRVTTVTSTAPGNVVDLDLYYVGPRGLVPRGDRGPPDVSRGLDVAEEVLSRHGIRFGTIRQHEIVGGLRDRYALIESGPDFDLVELHELFALSAAAGRPTISVFFVREIDVALGIAGGAPGPPGVHGTPGSGIAISVDLLTIPGLPEGVDIGRTLAHELGHYLGLFHTSEVDGLIIEPLPDTPECGFEHDVDGDGYVLPEECEGAGADNLMFWAASGDTLTAQQGEVIRSMPVLR